MRQFENEREFYEREIHEACAVTAVASIELPASFLAYQALAATQHRGQEASGIATNNGELRVRADLGRVDNVFNEKMLRKTLTGHSAIGHNRYSTSGKKNRHPQPVTDRPASFAFVENGNSPEMELLEEELHRRSMNPHGMNDSEMKGFLLASEIRNKHELPDAVRRIYPLFRGAFTDIAMHGDLFVAFKDPYGLRPGSYAKTPDDGLMFASETCAFAPIQSDLIDELGAGQMLVFDGKSYEIQQLRDDVEPKLDVFELIYFAAPDSLLMGQRVAEIRKRLGRQLAEEHPIDGTLVIPTPASGHFAGRAFARVRSIDDDDSVLKNPYVHRTFIAPEQVRDQALLYKFRILPEMIDGQDVIVVDDSIVRGNTMQIFVRALRKAGAKSVAVLSAAPPVAYPDYYGIDTKSQDELIAANLSREEIRQYIGADYLGYLSLDGLLKALQVPADRLNLSCFTGEYPIDIGKRQLEIRTPKTSAT